MDPSVFAHPEKKVCATCQYWHGARALKFYTATNYRVMYDGWEGDCASWEIPRGAMFVCPRYRRWIELPPQKQ